MNADFRVTSPSFQHFSLRSSSFLKIHTSSQGKANEAITDIAAHQNYLIVWHRNIVQFSTFQKRQTHCELFSKSLTAFVELFGCV